MIADPKFSTGVGLVLYGASHEPLAEDVARKSVAVHPAAERPGTFRRLTDWVREMF